MTNPAIAAAEAAQARVNSCLKHNRSFRLEAGAGAGKTYSLIDALKTLIKERGDTLQRASQKIACITYTEVARGEIAQEIEQHPAILVETIHAFSWGFMGRFQTELRALVAATEDRYQGEKIAAAGGVAHQRVEYQQGFFGIDENRITLSHDDVPLLMAKLLNNKKYRALFAATYPVIFVDEYQDTDPHVMAAFATHFLAPDLGPRIGFFGDHWQTIYRNDYKLADLPGVEAIDKGSNFRSVPAIVDVLNRLRPELEQAVQNPDAAGEARFFHTNSYQGPRTNTSHAKNDTPAPVTAAFMDALRTRLSGEGWDFSPNTTKILMLTHNAIAAESGYPSIAQCFRYNEAFVKKEDPLIAFLVDVVEPMCLAYAEKRFGDMFRILGERPEIRAHSDKLGWRKDMAALTEYREHGSIGDVVDLLAKTRRPRLSDRVARRENELASIEPDTELPRSLLEHRQLRGVAYRELVNLARFIQGRTPFATQHSVKGAQFENVLVVLGGGWNHYNWPQLLELLTSGSLTPKNMQAFQRARNLFYVALSRPQTRLAVLATQTLSADALTTATHLFGAQNVKGLNV